MDNFNDEIMRFIRNCGPGVVGGYLEAAGILLFVGSILWFIFPFLPDHPPKKKPRV